jgi:hypothetical protein
MKTVKAVSYFFAAAAILMSGWASTASAWTYGIDTYDYTGNPALIGTVTGATYTAKVAVITNDSSSAEELNVDLYYGTFSGLYQYSPNDGANWINIPDTTTTWTRTVQAGDTVWLRVILTNDQGNTYHILSPSPWGEADEDYDEAYYWAFPPGSRYYTSGWQRDIAGYVAVVLE